MSKHDTGNGGKVLHDTDSTCIDHDTSKMSSTTFKEIAYGARFDFPFKLHQMLEDAHKAGNDRIISWQPHGKSFIIRSVTEFETVILPQYFTVKLRSFQRQLAIYGFERVKDESPGVVAYRHPLMVRGKASLCRQMTREKIKKINHRKGLETIPLNQLRMCQGNSMAEAPVVPVSPPLVPSQPRSSVVDGWSRSASSAHGTGYSSSLPLQAKFPLEQGALYGSATPFLLASSVHVIASSMVEENQNETGSSPSSWFVRRSSSFSTFLDGWGGTGEDDLLRFAYVANKFLDDHQMSLPCHDRKESPLCSQDIIMVVPPSTFPKDDDDHYNKTENDAVSWAVITNYDDHDTIPRISSTRLSSAH